MLADFLTEASEILAALDGALIALGDMPRVGSAEEAHHRIANSLQLVSALIGMEQHLVADPAAREALCNAVAGVLRARRAERGERLIRKGDQAEWHSTSEKGSKTVTGTAAYLPLNASFEVTSALVAALGPGQARYVGGAVRDTLLWLWGARGHFIKIRVTRLPQGELPPAQMDAFRDAVVRAAAD